MAFIPDDALDRYDELQPASQLGYSFVCRHRNHKTGIAPKSLDECAAKYGWSRATKFNVQKELTQNGWIEKTEHGIKPLIGDFSPVSKSKILDSAEHSESKKLDSETSDKSKNLDRKSKKLDSKSKNLDSTYIRNNQPLPASNQQEEKTLLETSSSVLPKILKTAVATELQKSDFQVAMDFLQKSIGKFPDGGAQGKALKWMFDNGATLEQIKSGLARHISEVGDRYRVSYATLQKQIFQWEKVVDKTKTKGYNSEKDMLSPDYKAPPVRMPFDVLVSVQFGAAGLAPTAENYETLKRNFLSRESNKGFDHEITDYERSDDFRTRFSESGQKQISRSAEGGGRDHFKPLASQMPVSR